MSLQFPHSLSTSSLSSFPHSLFISSLSPYPHSLSSLVHTTAFNTFGKLEVWHLTAYSRGKGNNSNWCNYRMGTPLQRGTRDLQQSPPLSSPRSQQYSTPRHRFCHLSNYLATLGILQSILIIKCAWSCSSGPPESQYLESHCPVSQRLNH